MEPLEDFFRSLEAKLRCSRERRAEVVQELAGHAEDRIEALVRAGHSRLAAQQMVRRELGAPDLLALKLSRANGWSVSAFVLRQVWALALVSAVFVAGLNALDLRGDLFFQAGLVPVLIGLSLFWFGFSGVVRELFWAVAFTNAVPFLLDNPHASLGLLLIACLPFLSAVVGHWIHCPRARQIAFLSGLCLVAAGLLSPFDRGLLQSFIGRGFPLGWFLVALIWLPWMLSHGLDLLSQRRQNKPQKGVPS